MRRAEALVWIASLATSGCGISFSGPPLRSTWSTGFWYWEGSSNLKRWANEPLDLLYVHVGRISRGETVYSRGWHVYGDLPDELPSAREYWIVFRLNKQSVPDSAAAPMIAREVANVLSAAARRKLHVMGVQLDIDSPTGSLPQYAAFLSEVRKVLPKGVQLSITALLDWFRSGTAIGEVIRQVDEFVPQFYDLGEAGSPDSGAAIAARIDGARWGPVFNRFGKRFRIGISTFGRARFIRTPSSRHVYLGFAFYGDLAPIDIAPNPAFQTQAARNPANELVLDYRASRKVRMGYNQFEPGDSVQFILATPEAVRDAVASVRQMNGHLAGVVFFRWPYSDKALAMQPDEVLAAAGLAERGSPARSAIHVVDGGCATVECADLYLESGEPFSPVQLRYRVRSSAEFEYFLPEKSVPVRMTGSAQLTVSLPPYCGRGRLYLGRAVTADRAEFTVKQEP